MYEHYEASKILLQRYLDQISEFPHKEGITPENAGKLLDILANFICDAVPFAAKALGQDEELVLARTVAGIKMRDVTEGDLELIRAQKVYSDE
jgi:hypothetical protein